MRGRADGAGYNGEARMTPSEWATGLSAVAWALHTAGQTSIKTCLMWL